MDEKAKVIYKPKAFAKLLGISVRTLQRWDDVGVLKAYRTPTNRRYYTEEQYQEYLKQSEDRVSDKK